MLFGFLVTLFAINCFLLVLIIMIQQGKGGMGIGALGGSSQMLFGGSGGQDLFQKITWILGAIFMFGSLTLALYRAKQTQVSGLIRQTKQAQYPTMPTQSQQAPVAPSAPAGEAQGNAGTDTE